MFNIILCISASFACQSISKMPTKSFFEQLQKFGSGKRNLLDLIFQIICSLVYNSKYAY